MFRHKMWEGHKTEDNRRMFMTSTRTLNQDTHIAYLWDYHAAPEVRSTIGRLENQQGRVAQHSPSWKLQRLGPRLLRGVLWLR